MGRQRKPYTGFGKELRRLMLERNIRSWVQLEELILEVTGEKYAHQSMSKYAAGTSQAPPEFVEAFRGTLNLSEKERKDLAEKFAYHSRPTETDSEQYTA